MGLTARPDEGFAFISRVAEAMGADRWKRMADELSAIGARLASGGVGFGYHNHNFEVVRVGERTGFDILVQESDPRSVSIELDVGWAAAAGQDPVALFERYSGRYTAIHMKDIKASTQPNTQLRMDPSDVGAGKLDWKRLLPAAHAAGVRNFFLEQEPPFATSRLDAARAGFAFLSALEA
jgi:sugar phosphate isomerase/epimerase